MGVDLRGPALYVISAHPAILSCEPLKIVVFRSVGSVKKSTLFSEICIFARLAANWLEPHTNAVSDT